MDRAERRHREHKAVARRRRIWRTWMRDDEKDYPMNNSFRTTMRPCSCALCKRPRYNRARDKWKEAA